jgi:hypothetical protein
MGSKINIILSNHGEKRKYEEEKQKILAGCPDKLGISVIRKTVGVRFIRATRETPFFFSPAHEHLTAKALPWSLEILFSLSGWQDQYKSLPSLLSSTVHCFPQNGDRTPHLLTPVQ